MKNNNLKDILIAIYYFTDTFIKGLISNIKHALEKPSRKRPPTKKRKLSAAEVVSLCMFRFYTGHKTWKEFYRHLTTYHKKDFPLLPSYGNFIEAVNQLSFLGMILLESFMEVFRNIPGVNKITFVDSTALRVCGNKRIFTHEVCKGIANRGMSSMGWFYGFKLHIICNELMQILDYRITSGNTDDRDGLAMIWNHIFGIIVADAGYLGKNWQEEARKCGKHLFAAVRANMKKLMTQAQHQLLKMRQCVETVFSVLKHRMGLETSLPRSPLGHFSHYIWCITSYQFKKFCSFFFNKPFLA